MPIFIHVRHDVYKEYLFSIHRWTSQSFAGHLLWLRVTLPRIAFPPTRSMSAIQDVGSRWWPIWMNMGQDGGFMGQYGSIWVNIWVADASDAEGGRPAPPHKAVDSAAQ